MKLDWDFAAESYLDQFASRERARVLHAVEKLPTKWDSLIGSALKQLKGDQDNVFSLRVGSDLRVLVRRGDDVITVVDVVRSSQVEGLRRLSERRPAAVG